jgi:hypothetical protein
LRRTPRTRFALFGRMEFAAQVIADVVKRKVKRRY